MYVCILDIRWLHVHVHVLIPLRFPYFPSCSLVFIVEKSIGFFITLKYSGTFLRSTGSRKGHELPWFSSSKIRA